MRLYRLVVALVFGVMSLAGATAASEKSWQAAIASVVEQRDRMREMADAIGAYHLGTAYNEIDVRDHICAILGRMLGKTELILQLEKDLPSKSDDGEEFRIAAQSLDNWLVNAKRLLSLDQARRIREWNLDCVGQVGIPTSASILIPGQSEGAFFDVNGDVLRVLGAVEVGFSEKLIAALNANPQTTTVALGSEGGVVREALLAGLEIRRRKLNTTLWNNCYSACPLVFAAGVSRTIWSPYPELGFHQIHADGQALRPDAPIYSLIEEYLVAMGIRAGPPIRWMLSATPSEMQAGSAEELCTTGFATWIQRNCFH